jgi:hypothetical protein
MNKFNYTLPSGKKFTLTAPDSTTQTEADRVFYSQVAAGTLIGYVPGQSIGAASAQNIKFTLSRLDRGTAGLDDRVILAITNGIPVISGVPNLIDVPLENPITQADVANISFDNTFTAPAIGPLNANQVQGLLAQIANFVDQPAAQMSDETGVGLYGFDCQQLEQAGYVKPGTYRQFIFDPSPLTHVLSAPGIWTGKNGVSTVNQFLSSPALQNDAMTTLLSKSYNSLTANGTITPPVTESVTAAVGQVYTQSGLQTVSQLSTATGIALPSVDNIVRSLSGSPIASLISTPVAGIKSLASGALNNLDSGALFSVSSVTSKLSNTATGGVAALVSNGSIFGTSAVTQWAKSGQIDQLLTGGGFGSASNFGGIGSALTNNIQGLNVLGKSSQFAAGFSNPLTSLSNLGNFNLSSLTTNLTGQLTGALGGLQGQLTGALGGLQGQLTGALGGLTGSLGNFGSLFNLSSFGSFGSIGGLFGGGGDALVSATKVAAGYSNTVNRAVVDQAFTKIVGSSKVPLPDFDARLPSSESVANAEDVAFAETRLADAGETDFASGVFTQDQLNRIL